MATHVTGNQRLLELARDLDCVQDNTKAGSFARLPVSLVRQMLNDLADCYATDVQVLGVKSFDEGFALGASVEHNAAVDAVASAMLMVLGKDRADGTIDLGAAGRFWPEQVSAVRTNDRPAEGPGWND